MGIMEIMKQAVALLICGCYAGLMAMFAIRASKVKINWKEQMDRLLTASGKQLKGNQKWYEERKVYLSRIGAAYLAGRTVLPEEYLLIQVSSALIACFLEGVFLGKVGVLGAAAGFFLPGIFLTMKNSRDNKRILRDVKGIYDTIQIKTQGGMFLTSAITECYKNTRNQRLKKALYEMSGQIIAKNDITETIDAFNMKFKNPYIDNLCIILKQSLDSGKTVEIMESIQDQLADMQNAVNLQIRNRLNAKVLFVQMLLYLVIVAFCISTSFVAVGMDVGL